MGRGHRDSVGPTSTSTTNFVSSIKSSAKRIASNISPPIRTDQAWDLVDTEYSPSLSTKRSSTSSRSSYQFRKENAAISQLSERKPLPSQLCRNQPSVLSSSSSQKALSTQQSLDQVPSPVPAFSTYADLNHSTPSLTMATPVFSNGLRPEYGKPPSTSQSSVSFGQGGNNTPLSTPSLPPASAGGVQNPSIVYQQIHDVSSKRISTLVYLRKAHEGRVYWFNTLLFSKSDLSRIPFFEPKRLARRATNYLLLGISLPSILDLNSSNPQDCLRTLHALLVEFESYQQIHPPEGGSASSLSRARLPQMFKRATHATTKGRRTSSATDIGLPISTSDPADLKAMTTGATAGSTASSFPANEQDLLPGEEYTHLLTPALPFDPDYFETFATLCEVLIDCYTRIISLISSPTMCAPGTGEIFAKADAKLRKIIVSGIIKEFEEESRKGAKSEFAGLGKVVLGGLM